MKGVVFRSFEAFLEEGGHEILADEAFGLESLSGDGAYTNVGNYPPSDLISMVVYVSETTGQPAGLLVRDFGEYLFHVLASAHADIIKGFTSCMDMLAGIESVIHRDVRKLYSSAELPRFDIEERDGDQSITLVYQSSRPFADLAEGLIRGAFAHYGIKKISSLSRYDLAPDGTHSKFEVVVSDGNRAG
ncbi:MAG: heme NO-binding domain-containing protein [Henriciella sp.]|jgi:hypothetical protein